MKTYFKIGDSSYGKMPYSEVCMSMQVAGKVMGFKILSDRAVQLLEPKTGKEFSFPILLGEAGFYTDSEGIYRND